MLSWIVRILGHRAAQKVLGPPRPGGALDIRFGMAILRDRRVPLRYKLLALALGVGIMMAVVAAEIPIESALALLLPFLGVELDLLADGAEMLIGPPLLAALLLPHLAPRPLIEALRAERYGLPVSAPALEQHAA